MLDSELDFDEIVEVFVTLPPGLDVEERRQLMSIIDEYINVTVERLSELLPECEFF